MEVTISIINYNYGKFLANAIESALNQDTETAYEVLLIDDGSTDESDEIANNYRSYQNFKISKTTNQGFGKSLSRAITEANGDYVFLLDADDYFSPHKLSTMMPFLKKEFLYVSDTSQYIDVNGKTLSGGASGSTSTIAINKAAAAALLPVENELSFFSLFKLGRGIILSEHLTYYRFHGNNMTNRTVAGKWQTYLAGITHNLANKLTDLSVQNTPSEWKVGRSDILNIACYFRAQAYYNELEACLELNQRQQAYIKFRKMMFWAIKYRKEITFFHLKMFIRTVLGKPSFPKERAKD